MEYLKQIQQSSIFVIVILIWSILWKGIALWKSANYKQRNWFIAILIVNTMGILEIAYLFKFAKQKMELSDLKFWGSKK